MSTMMVGMMMMVGVLSLACCGSSSSLVALVNEKIIKIDFLNFLLIRGWGKEKTTDPPKNDDLSLPPVSNNPPSNKTYPYDCVAGARKECKSSSKRQWCIDSYKKKCLDDGGYWGTSPPVSPFPPPSSNPPSSSNPTTPTSQPIVPSGPVCDAFALDAIKKKHGEYGGTSTDKLAILLWYNMNKTIPDFEAQKFVDGQGWVCPDGYTDTNCTDTYYSKYRCYKW